MPYWPTSFTLHATEARKGRVRKDLLSSVPGIKLRENAVIFQHRTGLTWERGKFSGSCRFFFMAWLYHQFRSFAISPNIRHHHTQMPFKAQARFFLSETGLSGQISLAQSIQIYLFFEKIMTPDRQETAQQVKKKKSRVRAVISLVCQDGASGSPCVWAYMVGLGQWVGNQRNMWHFHTRALNCWCESLWRAWAGGSSISKGPWVPAMSRPALPSMYELHTYIHMHHHN